MLIVVALRKPRLLAVALAALLIVAGCGLGVNATASPTPSTPPSASPTASPSPPTTLPTPPPTPDAVAALEIGSPYELVANPLNKALTASFAFAFDVADQHIESAFSGREIRQDGAFAGLVLVMTFDGLKVTRDIVDGAAHGAATDSGGKASFTTILGQHVAFVTTTDATFGMYGLHDEIVLVGGPTGTDARSLLTAIIKANS